MAAATAAVRAAVADGSPVGSNSHGEEPATLLSGRRRRRNPAGIWSQLFHSEV